MERQYVLNGNHNFNPNLPQSHQITPPSEGGNGQIHQPGQYQNIVWQTRSRQPDAFELTLIDALEQLFEAGISQLPELVDGLNARNLCDRNGEAWSVEGFGHFLQVNGY